MRFTWLVDMLQILGTHKLEGCVKIYNDFKIYNWLQCNFKNITFQDSHISAPGSRPLGPQR